MRASSVNSAGGTGKPGCPVGACEASGQGRRLRAGKDETLAGAPARCLKMCNRLTHPKNAKYGSHIACCRSRLRGRCFKNQFAARSLLRRSGRSWGRELGCRYVLRAQKARRFGSRKESRECRQFETRSNPAVAGGKASEMQNVRNGRARLLPKEGVSLRRKGHPITLRRFHATGLEPETWRLSRPSSKGFCHQRVGVRTRLRGKASRVGISAGFSRNSAAS